jgi:hypothetical protein
MNPAVFFDLFRTDFSTLLLYAALIFFVIYSFIITYHWMRWCVGYSMLVWSLAAYYAGSLVLLLILFGSYAAL